MKAFRRFRIFSSVILLAILTWTLAACGNSNNTTGNATANASNPITVRLGYFPNVTHAAALVGLARNTFAQDLAPNKLTTTTFNAGPNLINACSQVISILVMLVLTLLLMVTQQVKAVPCASSLGPQVVELV